MYKNIKKYKSIFLLIFTSLILSCSILYVFKVKAQENMQFSLTYGYGDSIKLSKFVPINITISKITKEQNIRLVIGVENKEDTDYVYKYPIKLEENLDYEHIYNIYLDSKSIAIDIKIYSENEDILYTERVDLEEKSKNNKILIGLLSDTKEELRYFDNIKLNYGLLDTKIVDLETKSFPIDSINLQQLDLIIISNYRIRDLSYEQSMALMDWVKNGGIMVLGTGKRVDDTLGRYAPELLDDMYEKPYIRTLNLRLSSKIDRLVDIYVLDLLIHGGNILISDNDFPLISSVNKEKGQIVVAAFDFIDISPYMEENDEYISNFLTKLIGIDNLEFFNDKSKTQDMTNYFDIKSVLQVPDFNKLPYLGIYFVLIFMYILLAGPLMHILLRQSNMLSLYTKFMLALSICFAILVYILGNMSRYKAPFYTSASINNVNEDYISKKIFVNISSPYNKLYDVNVDNTYSFQDIRDDAVSGNDNKVVLNCSEDKTNIVFLNNEAFENHIFKLEKKYKNVEGIGISGYINLNADGLSGYIENNYNYDLESVAILFYSKLIKIGDLKAKEKLSLDDKNVLNIPRTNYFEIARYINSKDQDMDILSNEYVLNFQRNNLLYFYMDNFLMGYTQDAKVLAFAKDNNYEEKFTDNIEGKSISLFVSNLNVDNKNEDGNIYRQALIKNPAVLSGEYYVGTNTFYAKEALVLEYYLGEDVDVEELRFENLSLDIDENINITEFKDQVYLYDYTKENFIRKDPNKNIYTKEELEPYLSKTNSIRVRYFNTDDNTVDMYLSLPMLSIVAKQR